MADIVNAGQETTGALNSGAMPSNTDLVIYKGDYLRLVVTVKDSAGVPLNLTGCIARASLKTDYADRDPKPITCTITGTAGQVTLFMSSTITSELLPGNYIYDFQITFTDNETRTFLTGDVTVYNEVTT